MLALLLSCLIQISSTAAASAEQSANQSAASEAEPVTPMGLPEAQREAALATTPLSEFEIRACDQVWVFSSRSVCLSTTPTDRLHITSRSRDARWRQRSFADFLASNSDGGDRRTVVYIHGNLTPHSKALRDGLATYDQTFLAWEDAPPVRFVIWSWPSTQVKRGVRDVKLKASFAETHAIHLARWLGTLPPSEKVSLIGYSYGGRLAINALHLVSNGACQGHHVGISQQPKVNLTLVAAGIRNDCFLNTHPRALTRVDHLFVLYNSRDQYLRFYRLLRFDGRKDALGFTGLRAYRSGQIAPSRIKQFDASTRVGREHSYLDYVADRRIDQLLRESIFTGQLFTEQRR